MVVNFRNVTGVSTNAGSSALKNAGSLFKSAFESLSGITKRNDQKEIDSNTDIALSKLQTLASEDELNSAASNFSNDSLTNAFGSGKFNLGKITAALISKRKNIKDVARQDNADVNNEILFKNKLTTFDNSIEDRTDKKVEEKVALELAPFSEQATLTLAENKAKLDATLTANPTSKKLSPLENTKAVTDLREFVKNALPDSSFGSSLTGELGGSELQDEISVILKDGINNNGNVIKDIDPRIIQVSIQQITKDAGNEGFLDPSVDRGDLIKQILINIERSKLNTAINTQANSEFQSSKRNITSALKKLTDSARSRISGK